MAGTFMEEGRIKTVRSEAMAMRGWQREWNRKMEKPPQSPNSPRTKKQILRLVAW